MLLKDILATKGTDVLLIEPSATMADAVDKMVAHRCGCLVVCEGKSMVGIISERDFIGVTRDHLLARLGEPAAEGDAPEPL